MVMDAGLSLDVVVLAVDAALFGDEWEGPGEGSWNSETVRSRGTEEDLCLVDLAAMMCR